MHVTSAQSRVLRAFFTAKLDTMQTFAFQRKRKKLYMKSRPSMQSIL